jgi:hypothetical protein
LVHTKSGTPNKKWIVHTVPTKSESLSSLREPLPSMGSTVTSLTISMSSLSMGGDFSEDSKESSRTSKSGVGIRLGDCDSDLVTSALGNDCGTEEADTDFLELLGSVPEGRISAFCKLPGGVFGEDEDSKVSSRTSKSGGGKRLGDCDCDLAAGEATSFLDNDWGTEEADTDFLELLGGIFNAAVRLFAAISASSMFSILNSLETFIGLPET